VATAVASRPSRAGSLRGAERPRIQVHPEFDRSYGQAAIDLVEMAGRPMDGWQQDALRIMCAVRDDGLWTCFEYAEIIARQNGKTAMAEARAIAGLLLFDERLIMWSAHEYKTAMEAFRSVGSLLRKLGREVGDKYILIDDGDGHTITIKVNNTNGEESFERVDTGARLKFVARSKGSGRGFTADVQIIDEAYAYTPLQHAALLPTMSAVPNPQIIYLSSPPLDGESGEILYGLRERAEAMLKDPSAEDALAVRIWGGAGDLDHLEGIDLGDYMLWALANPALGKRISQEYVDREFASMIKAAKIEFARERCGIWPVPAVKAGGRIDPERWERLQDPTSARVPGSACSIGVQIAAELDYAAIVLYGVREDGLGHIELVDRRAGLAWLVPRLTELRRALDPVAVGMNAATFGVLKTDLKTAGMVRPEDRKGDEVDSDTRPRRGDLLVTNGPESAAACGQLLVAVGEKTFRVKPHPTTPEILDEAALGAKTRRAGDALAWVLVDKTSELDISPVGAMTSARYAHLARVDALAVKKPPPAPPLVARDAGLSETADLSQTGF
jgi:hypothetical protein